MIAIALGVMLGFVGLWVFLVSLATVAGWFRLKPAPYVPLPREHLLSFDGSKYRNQA